MPIAVVCPNGHRMTLPDKQAGKRYRCPLCFEYINVPLLDSAPAETANNQTARISGPPPESPGLPVRPAAPVPPKPKVTEEEEDAGGQARRWAHVERGLGFLYARLVIVLVCFLLGLSRLILEGSILSKVNQILVLTEAVGLLVAGPVLGLIGSLFSLRVPRYTGARPYIVLSFLLDPVSLPFAYFYFVGQYTPQGELLVLLGGRAAQAMSWVLYILFQRRLAVHFNEEIAADEAAQILVWGVILVPAPWALVGAFLLLFQVAPFLAFITGPGWMVLPFVLIVLYVKFLLRQLALLGTLRQVIRSKE